MFNQKMFDVNEQWHPARIKAWRADNTLSLVRTKAVPKPSAKRLSRAQELANEVKDGQSDNLYNNRRW